MKTLIDAVSKSPKGSIQKRVIRAILITGSSSTYELDKLLREYGVSSFGGSQRVQAKKDYTCMMSGNVITKTEFSRRTCSNAQIELVVKFILCPDYVATISWGNRTHTLSDDESIVLPLIPRKASKKFFSANILSTWKVQISIRNK